ncbi:hypothetical protein BC834DRAFT_969341 [Gloeopeniophorella convolvens]|nr:hypothetical protein BC834DRAFT_969341 [Gloeopeniophorella convolvens]
MTATRPRFTPSLCEPDLDAVEPLVFADTHAPWTPIISCPADFPPELFEPAVSQLIHHPEYNSTLILRSEVISDDSDTILDGSSTLPDLVPALRGLQPVRNIHRRLLARRPTRDSDLEQHCTLYAPSPRPDADPAPLQPQPQPHPNTLVLTPIPPADGAPLPYYHPAAAHLAFRYLASGALRIDAVPHPGTPLDPAARLHRTCRALLEALHRYGWGAATQYRKRVAHDVLVPREAYQDLYLVMRERHKHLVASWREATDPLKHVFEDIGIATFLMLLWRDTFGPETAPPAPAPPAEPWRAWPRPPGGFADLGCGNGLLTHILLAEGYAGHGLDLRARTSWAHYPPATRARLAVRALDPTRAEDVGVGASVGGAGCWLVGNHADELTPWLPLLARRTRAAGFLSIPCCAWALDARFERARDAPLVVLDPDALNLGGEGTGSSYAQYRVWLAALSVHCGWAVEVEVLRIPSTRNWAIVGRTRVGDEDEAEHNVEELIEGVRRRGQFKTRRPEGKAGDH